MSAPDPFAVDEDDVVTADFIPDAFTEGLAVPRIGELLASAGDGVASADRSIRQFVKDKPVVAVAVAVAAGLIIGRLISRR
ncbi:MAG: hypothetical protein Q8O67_16340 [Deltaproteobacteria bacterium]|nr:hypothetical protein [Deltaproteobacteria bacterium]